MESSRRFRELDALRGLAALAVVLYHYLNQYPHRFDRSLFVPPGMEFGRFGVELFFIISGFVIYMTLDRVAAVRTFALFRFTRLYPLYWVGIALTFGVLTVSSLPDVHVSTLDAVLNLTMLGGFFGVPYVDGAYWSLTVELGFYFLIAALIAMRRARWALQVLVAIAFSFMIVNLAVRWLPVNGALAWVDAHAYFLRFAHFFAAGVAFFLLFVRRQRSALVVAALVLAPLIEWADGEASAALVVVGLLAVVAIALGLRPAALRWRPLLFLGAISYALYIVHQNIGYVVIRWSDGLGLNHWISVIGALALSISIAAVLTKVVERPAQRVLRRRLSPQVVEAPDALPPSG